MAENLQITADVYANTRPAAAQIKAFSDKNLNNLRLNLAVNDSGLKKGSNGLGQIRNDADQFTKSMAAANARVLAFGTAVSVIETMRRSFLALIKTTVDVEQALAKISVVAGDDLQKAGVSISQLGKSIFNIARDTGQSFETVNEATLEFQRQGIGVQESLKRTRDAMIAVRISGVSVGDAVSGLTSILNAFKKSGLDSTTALNKLVALDNSSAASLPDLFQGLQRAASVSQLAGNNFNQTAASIATLQEITARGGPVIGNALKSIDTRLYGEKSLKFLSEFQGGIVKVKDEAGQLLPSIEIIRNLSGALKTLPKGEQLGVLTELSGLYQVNSLSALVDSFQLVDGEISLYDKNLKTITNASNEASAANKKLSTTLASQFNTINVNVGEFLNKLGEIGVKNPLSGVLDFLIRIQGTLQNILEGSSPLDKIVQTAVKFTGGTLFSAPVIAGGAFILVKIIKDFIKFAATALQTFTGINKQMSQEDSLTSGINSKLKANTGELNSAYSAEQRRLSIIKSANAEYSKQIALVSGIASASNGTRQRFVDKNLTEGAVNVRRSGGIVGDVSSYLPTIVGGKSDNLASKLGSEIKNNRPTVVQSQPLPAGLPYGQPNIPTGLKNNAGQFIPTGTISNALGLMINSWVFAGKQALEMGNLIRKEAGRFDLGQSFAVVSKAANKFAQGLIRDRNLLTAQAKAAIPGSVNGLNTGGTGFTSSPQFSGLGFRAPATEVSKVGLGGFPNIAALPQFDPERLAATRAVKARAQIDRSPSGLDAQTRAANAQFFRAQLESNVKTIQASRIELGQYEKRLNELQVGKRGSGGLIGQAQGVVPRQILLAERDELLQKSRVATDRINNPIFGANRGRDLAAERLRYFGYNDNVFSNKTNISENERIKQQALKQQLQEKFNNRISAGQPLLQGGSTLTGLQRSDGPLSTPPKSTGFTSEAFKNFAYKTIAVTALFAGLSSSLLGVSPGLDKFADFLDTATLSGGGIAALNEVGGVSAKSLLEDFKGFDLKGISGGGGLLGKAVAPLLVFGRGLLNILPGIGQIALGLTIFNEAIRAITGTSGIDRLSLMFGGLTEEASKAKDRFNEIAKELFDPNGKYTARSLTDRQSSLSNARSEATQRIIAQKQGIKIDGKNPQEVADATFRKLLSDAVANVKTGSLISDLSGAGGIGGGFRDAVIGDLSASALQSLDTILADVSSGTLEDLRANAKSIGITAIGDKTVDAASIEELQTAIAKAFTEQFIKAYSSKYSKDEFGINTDFNKLILDQSGQQRLAGFALNFIGKGASKTEQALPFASAKGDTPESQKKFFDFQKDFLDSIYNGASAQIEAEIKNLDAKANDPSLTQKARRELERQKDELARRALDVGNLSDKAQFENSKKLNQSQLDVNGKTQQDIDRELIVLKENFKNANSQYQANIKSLGQETNSRDKANASLDRLTRATDSAQASLSNLSVIRAINNQKASTLDNAANNPAISNTERENLQRAASQERINDLKQNGFKTIQEEARIAREEAKSLPSDKRGQKFKEINDSSRKQVIDLETQIAALESSSQQLGKIADFTTELTNLFDSFNKGLPSSRAQNDFNTLQSTDSSSLVGGLISKQVFGQAEGKSGQELVSFLADQNTLLNEQFKIKTAASATEKLDLETQLALTKEILDIKTQELDPLEKQQKIEEAINKNLALRRSFGFGVSQAQAGIQSEIQTFNSDFGKTATNGFRDALVGAMQAAVTKTEDLKSALLNVALTFANKLRDAALENLANIIVNSGSKQGGGSSGGLISSVIGGIAGLFPSGSSVQKKAAGGMISGGSGTKDDVPTLLMGGEYVIPKSTVQQYGLGFFEGLRNGSIGKMAQGGYFEPGTRGQGAISGNANLLDFATQTATSGAGDVTRSLGGGAAIAALEPESLRLSNFARFGDSPIVQSTQEAKNQAFGLYLDGLNTEKEYAAQQEAIKKAKKDQLKGLWTALAVAVVGGAISYGANKYGASSKKAPKALSADAPAEYNAQSGLYETPRAYQTAPKSSSGGFLSSLTQLFKGSRSGSSYAPAPTSRDGFYNPYPSQTTLPLNISSLSATRGVYSGGYNNPLFNGINVNGQYRNAGGYVGGNGDTVPAMLSNKEFVLNSSAAQKIGDKNLYALNNGGTPSSNTGSDEKLIAKLDELIQKTIGASNVTVSVSMDSSGNATSSDKSSSNGSQDNQKALSQKIKDTVISILREEQRPGGVLSRR